MMTSDMGILDLTDEHGAAPGAPVVRIDLAGTAVFLVALGIAVPLRTHRFAQFCFVPFHCVIARHHHLRNAVARRQVYRFPTQILHNHANLPAIAGVDGSRAVRQCNPVLQRESAAGADLRFKARRQFDCDAGGDKRDLSGRNGCGGDGIQIHAGVFVRTMRIAGNSGVGVEAVNADSGQVVS